MNYDRFIVYESIKSSLRPLRAIEYVQTENYDFWTV